MRHLSDKLVMLKQLTWPGRDDQLYLIVYPSNLQAYSPNFFHSSLKKRSANSSVPKIHTKVFSKVLSEANVGNFGGHFLTPKSHVREQRALDLAKLIFIPEAPQKVFITSITMRTCDLVALKNNRRSSTNMRCDTQGPPLETATGFQILEETFEKIKQASLSIHNTKR
ncbi:hypothetical protein PIB30_040388 [Stylosanthes scabra]|uniref:Uncharacterized protein n=1 Tax=Stylosanthes scabra TaxID=79078 RepID=A0ABU6ZD95_9FABA|nr:hypothetical protein [Stylosanthes scabra]